MPLRGTWSPEEDIMCPSPTVTVFPLKESLPELGATISQLDWKLEISKDPHGSTALGSGVTGAFKDIVFYRATGV